MSVYKDLIWGNLPLDQMRNDPDIGHIFFDDFHNFDSTATTGTWTATQLTGSGTAACVSGKGGILLLDSASTTVDTGIQVQATASASYEQFKMTAGTRLGFEARVSMIDGVTEAQFFCGLGLCDTTFFALGINTTDDHIGFEMDAADVAAIATDPIRAGKAQFVSELSGTRTDVANVYTWTEATALATGTWVRLGFYYDGSRGIVIPVVNGVAKTAVTANIPTDQEMVPTMLIAHEAAPVALTADSVLYVDWIMCASTDRY